MQQAIIIGKRIAALRKTMLQNKLDVYLLPTADPHNSEYIAEHWKSREWMSGFNGSAGMLVVTREQAALWTDSRYFLQAEQQLQGTGIDLMKEGVDDTPTPQKWIYHIFSLPKRKNIPRIGFDYETFPLSRYKEENWEQFETVDIDLMDKIWSDRPPLPTTPIVRQPLQWAGCSTADKTELLRTEVFSDSEVDYYLLSDLSEIAWLLNLRGNDIDYNPLFLAYLLIGRKNMHLFTDPVRIDTTVSDYLQKEHISLHPYDAFHSFLSTMEPKETTIGYAGSLNLKYTTLLDQMRFNTHISGSQTPVPALRSIKNPDEVQGFRRAMLLDGIALIRFHRELDEKKAMGTISDETELSIDQRLTALRAKHNEFRGLSFGTISAYGAHAAIVHYEASPESNIHLEPHGFLLLDSGAHYESGTTDITRTIPLGKLTHEERLAYTLVLKGHIALARAHFPENTTGLALDLSARYPLWQRGFDFGHGTGHGVGSYLCVHEGPQQIRKNSNAASCTPLRAGMTITDEPGLYFSEKFGIRLENILLIRESSKTQFGKFLEFETLTLCPFDTSPILLEMLDETEKEWLNHYHLTVCEQLLPHLQDERDREWLLAATLPVA